MESRPMMYRSSVEIDYAHDESVISKETADVVGSPVDGTTPLQRGLVGSLELLESHAESVLVGGGGGGGGAAAAAAADAKLPSSGPLHQQTVSPKNKSKGTVPFYKLFSFAAPLDYVLMILGTLAAFAHGTSFPVFFIFFSKLINEVASNFFNIPKQSEEVAKYGLYFFYLGIILLGTAWIEVACWMQTGERQSARIRTKYLRAMLAQDIAFFDKDASTGEIVSRISNDTLVVQEAIGEKMGIFLHYLAMFVAGICVSLSALWQITLVTLSVLPIIAVTGGIYITYKTTQASRSQEAYMMASVVAEEAIAHIRTVYSFVGESKAMSAYQRALQGTMKTARKAAFAKGLSVGIMHGALIGIWALLFWYASKLVIKGAANGAVAMTTVVNAVISGLALGQVAPTLPMFAKAKAAAYNILEMINRKQDQQQISSFRKGKVLSQVNGHIEFCNVSFRYPSRPEARVFDKLCLSIPAGKSVAIVGSSGSGKSTVISLIERFYDPTSGEVLLDGHNLESLQLQWLRGQIGLVNQEPVLFATSILENILYGKDGATMDEIHEVCKAAKVHDFISKLPDAYNTKVGERGVQLSGGQKQRVAIARAMLKNPSILLLDEATSALDSGSEQIVQEALDQSMVGRTTILVAHRLSTIRNVYKIFVMQNGRVAESGTHDELLERGESGLYSKLVKLQANVQVTVPEEPNFSSELGASLSRQVSKSSKRHSARSISLRWSQQLSIRRSESRLEMDGTYLPRYENLENIEHIEGPSTWRLIKLNAGEWHYALLGSVNAILSGWKSPFTGLVMSTVLVSLYTSSNIQQEVDKICIYMTIAIPVSVIVFLLHSYAFELMGERTTLRVREKMFSVILRQEIGWFDRDENNSSLLASRLAIHAVAVRTAIGDRMSMVLQSLAVIGGAFGLAFYFQPRLAAVLLCSYPLMIGGFVGEALFLKGFGGDLAKCYAQASMVATDAVSNIRTVAAFGAEEKVLDLFLAELEEPRKRTQSRSQIAGFFYGLSQFFIFSSYGLTMYYASVLIKKRVIFGIDGFAHLVKCIIIVMFSALLLAETLTSASDVMNCGQALKSIFSIIDRKTEIDPDDENASEVSEVKGEVELKHVTFAYPSRPESYIFKDFCLRVPAAKSLALVGASGSGKSSVIALIARFYDPVAGVVTVDGKDIRTVKLRQLRQHIGLVQQEPSLFATTIYENILYGREGASESEVINAAKAANAHNFISALPNGYKTAVGERGVQLSGGQKQRVAIARAVLKDPAILLLDEATSALDSESERVVQAALESLMRGRTTVLIAHRLSTIRNVDTIAFINDGQVQEKGSHQSLMSKPESAYAQFVSIHQQK